MSDSAHSPFQTLKAYHVAALAHQRLYPVASEDDLWSGIAVRVADQVLLLPMSQTREIIDVPKCTIFPGTKHWFVGVGSVRGSMIAITDLSALDTDMPQQRKSKRQRVVICGDGERRAGLLVEEVLGRRKYSREHVQPVPPNHVIGALRPFCNEAYKEHMLYPVLDTGALLQSALFLEAMINRR